MVPPPSLCRSPAPLCKSGSKLLAAAVARRASWAELGGARQDGEELGGLKKWRGQFHTEKSGMGVGEHDKVEGRFRRSY